MDDFGDLISAIDDAPVHAQNNYWSWAPETREEYKQYYAAKRARDRVPAAPALEEEGDEEEEDTEEGDDEELEALLQEESTQQEETEQKEEPAPVKDEKKEPSRWVQYQQIARSELKEASGRSKVPLKEVNELARRMYREDGWCE